MALYGCLILPVIFSDQCKQIDKNRLTDFPGVLALRIHFRANFFFILEYFIDMDELLVLSQIDLF